MLHTSGTSGRNLSRKTEEGGDGWDDHDARAREGVDDGGDATFLSGAENTDRHEAVRASPTFLAVATRRRYQLERQET